MWSDRKINKYKLSRGDFLVVFCSAALIRLFLPPSLSCQARSQREGEVDIIVKYILKQFKLKKTKPDDEMNAKWAWLATSSLMWLLMRRPKSTNPFIDKSSRSVDWKTVKMPKKRWKGMCLSLTMAIAFASYLETTLLLPLESFDTKGRAEPRYIANNIIEGFEFEHYFLFISLFFRYTLYFFLYFCQSLSFFVQPKTMMMLVNLCSS